MQLEFLNLSFFVAVILTFYFLLHRYEQWAYTGRITAMIQQGEETVAEKERTMSITDILGTSEGVTKSMNAFNMLDTVTKSGMLGKMQTAVFYLVSALTNALVLHVKLGFRRSHLHRGSSLYR